MHFWAHLLFRWHIFSHSCRQVAERRRVALRPSLRLQQPDLKHRGLYVRFWCWSVRLRQRGILSIELPFCINITLTSYVDHYRKGRFFCLPQQTGMQLSHDTHDVLCIRDRYVAFSHFWLKATSSKPIIDTERLSGKCRNCFNSTVPYPVTFLLE